MAERQKQDRVTAERSSLGDQVRPRPVHNVVDRLDSRGAPGMGGMQNSGSSLLTEHVGKILLFIGLGTLQALVAANASDIF